jgi:hypothetical protein
VIRTLLSPDRREAINAQFIRAFAGEATAEDVHDVAQNISCDVVLAEDKAWTNDPFASSSDYRLADSRDNEWRIYVASGLSH